MAGKGTVGKLSVKVVPDLSGFAQKLRADLKRIQKQVKDLDIKFNAEVELDKASLQKAKAEVAKENLKLRTHVDADGTETEIQKLKRRIENMRARGLKPMLALMRIRRRSLRSG